MSPSKRQFVRLQQAWYADPALVGNIYPQEEISLQLVPENELDGVDGEVWVRWMNVGGEPTPRLEAFGDSWELLTSFTDVLAQITKARPNGNIGVDEFQRMLLEAGFKDATPRRAPAKVQQHIDARREAGNRSALKP